MTHTRFLNKGNNKKTKVVRGMIPDTMHLPGQLYKN